MTSPDIEYEQLPIFLNWIAKRANHATSRKNRLSRAFLAGGSFRTRLRGSVALLSLRKIILSQKELLKVYF